MLVSGFSALQLKHSSCCSLQAALPDHQHFSPSLAAANPCPLSCAFGDPLLTSKTGKGFWTISYLPWHQLSKEHQSCHLCFSCLLCLFIRAEKVNKCQSTYLSSRSEAYTAEETPLLPNYLVSTFQQWQQSASSLPLRIYPLS